MTGTQKKCDNKTMLEFWIAVALISTACLIGIILKHHKEK